MGLCSMSIPTPSSGFSAHWLFIGKYERGWVWNGKKQQVQRPAILRKQPIFKGLSPSGSFPQNSSLFGLYWKRSRDFSLSSDNHHSHLIIYNQIKLTAIQSYFSWLSCKYFKDASKLPKYSHNSCSCPDHHVIFCDRFNIHVQRKPKHYCFDTLLQKRHLWVGLFHYCFVWEERQWQHAQFGLKFLWSQCLVFEVFKAGVYQCYPTGSPGCQSEAPAHWF